MNSAAVLHGGLRSLEATSSAVFTGLSSRVQMSDNSAMHIPQLDFHIAPSSRALGILEELLATIAPCSGWILESGGSYHFWGADLVSQETSTQFLGRALLYAPLTDKNWIAHQLIEGACTLRIFGNPQTGAGAPTVVRTFIKP